MNKCKYEIKDALKEAFTNTLGTQKRWLHISVSWKASWSSVGIKWMKHTWNRVNSMYRGRITVFLSLSPIPTIGYMNIWSRKRHLSFSTVITEKDYLPRQSKKLACRLRCQSFEFCQDDPIPERWITLNALRKEGAFEILLPTPTLAYFVNKIKALIELRVFPSWGQAHTFPFPHFPTRHLLSLPFPLQSSKNPSIASVTVSWAYTVQMAHFYYLFNFLIF